MTSLLARTRLTTGTGATTSATTGTAGTLAAAVAPVTGGSLETGPGTAYPFGRPEDAAPGGVEAPIPGTGLSVSDLRVPDSQEHLTVLARAVRRHVATAVAEGLPVPGTTLTLVAPGYRTGGVLSTFETVAAHAPTGIPTGTESLRAWEQLPEVPRTRPATRDVVRATVSLPRNGTVRAVASLWADGPNRDLLASSREELRAAVESAFTSPAGVRLRALYRATRELDHLLLSPDGSALVDLSGAHWRPLETALRQAQLELGANSLPEPARSIALTMARDWHADLATLLATALAVAS